MCYVASGTIDMCTRFERCGRSINEIRHAAKDTIESHERLESTMQTLSFSRFHPDNVVEVTLFFAPYTSIVQNVFNSRGTYSHYEERYG